MADRRRRVISSHRAGGSLTKQHQAAQTDINNILARYRTTGIMSPESITKRDAMFADVSELGDFHLIQNKIVEAQAAFMTLPAPVRSRFNNNPADLIMFLEDPANRQEAIDLGIIPDPEQVLAAKAAIAEKERKRAASEASEEALETPTTPPETT